MEQLGKNIPKAIWTSTPTSMDYLLNCLNLWNCTNIKLDLSTHVVTLKLDSTLKLVQLQQVYQDF
jgi:hypothetical protein